MLSGSSLNPVKVVNDIVKNSDCIRYLGEWLDNMLKFDVHVGKKCSTAICIIRKIRHIREFIDNNTCNILCCALVLSHVGYSNGILCGAKGSKHSGKVGTE